jgi:class 3 adenylate cyclase
MARTSPPTGTVTFLFTDIEGSTRLWEEDPAGMEGALADHDAVLRQAIEVHAGHIFKTIGDAFCTAFSTPSDALAAAFDAPRADGPAHRSTRAS